MSRSATPPPTSAPSSTGRNPSRSPSAPPSVAATAPTSAAVPTHEPDRRRQPRPGPDEALDDHRLVRPRQLVREVRHEVDREDPPDRRIAEDASDRAVREREHPPLGHDRRPDLARSEPRRAARSRPTARPTTRTPPRATSPRPSTRKAAEDRPDREPDRAGGAEDRDDRADPRERRDVADPGQHHPGVPELEPDQQQAERELPRLLRQRDAGEHDRLDEAAPDDDRLARVLVGPDAPERHERRPDDEDQRREQADERQRARPRRRPSG